MDGEADAQRAAAPETIRDWAVEGLADPEGDEVDGEYGWTRAGLAARSRAMAWKLGRYMSMDKGPRAVSAPRMSGSFPGRGLAIERDQNSVRTEPVCFMSVPPRIVESRRRVVEPSPLPKV